MESILQANDSFTHVISGGRDRKVFMTDLRNPDRRVLICEETDPVLKIILSPDQNSIWVSTAGCDIKNWVSHHHTCVEKTFFSLLVWV